MMPFEVMRMRKPGLARATIVFVGSGTVTFSGTGGTTYNFSSLLNESNVAPTMQENDLVILSQCNATSGTAANIGPPSGYTELAEVDNGVDHNFCVFYKFMSSSPDTSVAIPGQGFTTWNAATIYVFRNVDTGTPFDVTATTATGASGSVDPPSITPATDGALIVATGGTRSGNANHTNISGFSGTTNHFRTTFLASSVDPTVATALKLGWVSADGAVDPGTFGGATGKWSAVSFALRPKLA